MGSLRFRTGGNTIAAKCAGALTAWGEIDEPAEIEEAVQAFLPKDQPLRDETIQTLAEVRARRWVACMYRQRCQSDTTATRFSTRR